MENNQEKPGKQTGNTVIAVDASDLRMILKLLEKFWPETAARMREKYHVGDAV